MGQMKPGDIEEALKNCDAVGAASLYYNPAEGQYTCRCLICARCEHHAVGMYGHYTQVCKNWPVPEKPRTMKEFSEMTRKTPPHFCCPEGCELNE